MRIGVCDYPSAYLFPPRGYGSIERWLWAVAVGAREWGAEVWLLGPQWRNDLPSEFQRLNFRLEHLRRGGKGFSKLGSLDFDLLVAGHEYPALPAWRRTWQSLGCDVATFQHDPHFEHPPDTFDGVESRLYCYSGEMLCRYVQHNPRRTLSVQVGLEEQPLAPMAGGDLLWLGRICEEKAPHLAALAAESIGARLRLVGPIHDETYVRRHAYVLGAAHVEGVGEVGGLAKARILAEAGVLLYTCSRTYIEAGAAVFGDALRAGTPVAALAWRADTCADAALCDQSGSVARVPADVDDFTAVEALAQAIRTAKMLDARSVQSIGLRRFHPVKHFEALAKLR